MQYWNEMLSLWGFIEGTKYPQGVACYRKVYCAVMNKVLKKNGSNCRVVPFNSQVQNYYRIILVTKDWYENSAFVKRVNLNMKEFVNQDESVPVCEPDKKFTESLTQAFNYEPDKFVIFQPTISERLDTFLDII